MSAPLPADAFDRQAASGRGGTDIGVGPPAVVLTVTAGQAHELHRSIPLLVADARRQLARHDGEDPHIRVDLSAVPPIPACAPLLLLLRLLRRAGPAATITVTGASPALAPCLLAGLPDGVVVVDRTGRRWPG